MTRYAVRIIYKVKQYAYSSKEIKEYYFDKYEDAKKDYDLGCEFLCEKPVCSNDDKRVIGVILAFQDIDEYSGEIEAFIIEEKFKRDRKHRKHNSI